MEVWNLYWTYWVFDPLSVYRRFGISIFGFSCVPPKFDLK